MPVAAAPVPRGNPFDPSEGTGDWSNGLFGCCSIQDCGCNCCIQECCCPCCIFGSMVAKSEIDPFDFGWDESSRCMASAAGVCCEGVPFQALMLRSVARLNVARKYGIKEDIVHAVFISCCCPCCADMQVENEVMVKEGLKFGCAQHVKAGGAPPSTEIAR